ncbi:MAG TPA: glycosyltransferase family 1 protein [Gammaproteobacteria bacterium]|nr:glycosyltransferase family 1 protein [Gammaproteobacteria bacterium]
MMPELYIVGGIEGLQAYSTKVVTDALSAALKRRGVKLTVLVRRPARVPRSTWLRWLTEAWQRYVRYPRWCRARIPAGAWVYVTDHANAACLLWLKRGCRGCVHVHDLASLRRPWTMPYPMAPHQLFIWLLSMLFKKPGLLRARHLVAISRFTRDELVRYLGIAEHRIAVARNGVDAALFYPEPRVPARAALHYASSCFVVLTVGHGALRKNYRVVVEALALLKERIAALRWVHVGDLGDKCQARAAALHLHFELLPSLHVTALRRHYSAADVLVAPSWYEGFGLTPLEALACGAAVVASAIPAHREVLRSQARYFPPDNPQALADVLSQIAQGTAGKEHSRRARAAFARRYSWDRTAHKICQLIEASEDTGVTVKGAQHGRFP